MDIPKLKAGNCSVLIVEYATGIICKRDLTYHLTGENENDLFQVLKNIEEAKEYALHFAVTNPKFECSVYSHFGEHLFTFDLNGQREYPK